MLNTVKHLSTLARLLPPPSQLPHSWCQLQKQYPENFRAGALTSNQIGPFWWAHMRKTDSFPFSYSQGTVRATSNTNCNCNTNSHLVVALDFQDAETGLVEYHWFPHATLTMELCNLTGPTGEETLVHDEVTPNLLAPWFPVSVLTRRPEQGHSRACRIFLLQKIMPNHCPKMETKEKLRQIWDAHVPCTCIGATPLWTSTGAIN